MIGKVRELNYSEVRSKIDELCVSNMFFNGDAVQLMKEIVPEYISNNSDFCKLDESADSTSTEEQKIEVDSPEQELRSSQ